MSGKENPDILLCATLCAVSPHTPVIPPAWAASLISQRHRQGGCEGLQGCFHFQVRALSGGPAQSSCEEQRKRAQAVMLSPQSPGLRCSLSLGPCPTPSCRRTYLGREDAQELLNSGGARRIVQVGWAVFWGEVEGGPSFAFISSTQVCAHQGLTALPQQSGHTGPKCDFPGLCGRTGSGAVPPAAAVGQVQGCFPCALVVVGSRGRRGSQLLSGDLPGGRRVAASSTVEAGRSWHQDSAFPGSTCHREAPGARWSLLGDVGQR